jgi:hypothetical protein
VTSTYARKPGAQRPQLCALAPDGQSSLKPARIGKRDLSHCSRSASYSAAYGKGRRSGAMGAGAGDQGAAGVAGGDNVAATLRRTRFLGVSYALDRSLCTRGTRTTPAGPSSATRGASRDAPASCSVASAPRRCALGRQVAVALRLTTRTAPAPTTIIARGIGHHQ